VVSVISGATECVVSTQKPQAEKERSWVCPEELVPPSKDNSLYISFVL
jgi:hypothetical protein